MTYETQNADDKMWPPYIEIFFHWHYGGWTTEGFTFLDPLKHKLFNLVI